MALRWLSVPFLRLLVEGNQPKTFAYFWKERRISDSSGVSLALMHSFHCGVLKPFYQFGVRSLLKAQYTCKIAPPAVKIEPAIRKL